MVVLSLVGLGEVVPTGGDEWGDLNHLLVRVGLNQVVVNCGSVLHVAVDWLLWWLWYVFHFFSRTIKLYFLLAKAEKVHTALIKD